MDVTVENSSSKVTKLDIATWAAFMTLAITAIIVPVSLPEISKTFSTSYSEGGRDGNGEEHSHAHNADFGRDIGAALGQKKVPGLGPIFIRRRAPICQRLSKLCHAHPGHDASWESAQAFLKHCLTR